VPRGVNSDWLHASKEPPPACGEIFDLKIVTNGVGCDIHHQRSVTRSTRAVTRSARDRRASLCESARYPIL